VKVGWVTGGRSENDTGAIGDAISHGPVLASAHSHEHIARGDDNTPSVLLLQHLQAIMLWYTVTCRLSSSSFNMVSLPFASPPHLTALEPIITRNGPHCTGLRWRAAFV
jgi:hypothetical protein